MPGIGRCGELLLVAFGSPVREMGERVHGDVKGDPPCDAGVWSAGGGGDTDSDSGGGHEGSEHDVVSHVRPRRIFLGTRYTRGGIRCGRCSDLVVPGFR